MISIYILFSNKKAMALAAFINDDYKCCKIIPTPKQIQSLLKKKCIRHKQSPWIPPYIFSPLKHDR